MPREAPTTRAKRITRKLLPSTRAMTPERVKRAYRALGLTPPRGRGVHTAKFHRCVIRCEERKKRTGRGPRSCHAVCMAAIGPEQAIKPEHRRYTELRRSYA